MLEVTVLGSGATFGVPLAGGVWGLCDPDNRKNERTRPSVCVTQNERSLVIDIGPDFRLQTARSKLVPDTILITHGHWDHIAGIGELPYYLEEVLRKDLHIYADAPSLRSVYSMFPYLFKELNSDGKTTIVCFGDDDEYRIHWHEIRPYVPFVANGIAIKPFAQHHGRTDSLGFRIGDFAYSSDCKSFPEESVPYLDNLNTWILDCDYWEPSDSHGDPQTVLDFANRFDPKRVFLTHMDEKMDYEKLSAWFSVRGKTNINPAFDGLSFVS